jgi:hypothetical protein
MKLAQKSASKSHQTTMFAYLTDSYTTLEDVVSSDNPANMLYYTDIEVETWTKVGTAEITVTLYPVEDVTKDMVAAIDSQIQATYADAESKINQLKAKKQSLLAITMEPT